MIQLNQVVHYKKDGEVKQAMICGIKVKMTSGDIVEYKDIFADEIQATDAIIAETTARKEALQAELQTLETKEQTLIMEKTSLMSKISPITK